VGLVMTRGLHWNAGRSIVPCCSDDQGRFEAALGVNSGACLRISGRDRMRTPAPGSMQLGNPIGKETSWAGATSTLDRRTDLSTHERQGGKNIMGWRN
jgi:hypothetical protein